MSRNEELRQIRAGIFVAAAVAILILAVFLVGQSQALFTRRLRLSAEFQNTAGLVVGAPVRLAGVDVGVVQGIRFDADLHHKLVRVSLGIDRRFSERVRADSVARLSSKGLLGDVVIDITVGSVDAAPLKDGARLQAQESEGMTEVLASLNGAVGEIRSLSSTAKNRIDTVFTDDLGRDLGRVARAAANVMERVEDGDGLAHEVIYDRRLASDARLIASDGRRMIEEAVGAVEHIDSILTAVKNGDGTLHGLIYRDDGGRLLAEVQRSAKKIGDLADEVRNGRGMLHELIYQRDQGDLVANLTALSRTLRELGDEAQQGKGTIGALLKDPSIYEDLKGIIGNVERSRVLRGLIRYEIQRDGLRAPGNR
jgi:phospholipid/cholesterol/gamma-HCH transport system substrate-binding protein